MKSYKALNLPERERTLHYIHSNDVPRCEGVQYTTCMDDGEAETVIPEGALIIWSYAWGWDDNAPGEPVDLHLLLDRDMTVEMVNQHMLNFYNWVMLSELSLIPRDGYVLEICERSPNANVGADVFVLFYGT